MAGTLTIPNEIGAQPGPRLAASLLDQNWTTIADYVNARQVTFDVVANRPAAGVAGRYFYATDQSTLYLDNGSSWLNVAGGGSGGGTASLPGSLNQNSNYLSGDHNKYQLTASQVTVTNLAGTSSHTLVSPANITIDLTVVGANGRDAGALSANSWAHLYWIYNPTTATLAGIVSASAWPTAAPTFPSGYTELAYAGAVRIDGAAQFLPTGIHGARTVFRDAVSVLSAGAASTDTTFSTAAAVPPNARWVYAYALMEATTNAGGTLEVYGIISMITGEANLLTVCQLAYYLDTGVKMADGSAFSMYNSNQQMSYKVTDSGGGAPASGTNQLNVTVSGYENPSNSV